MHKPALGDGGGLRRSRLGTGAGQPEGPPSDRTDKHNDASRVCSREHRTWKEQMSQFMVGRQPIFDARLSVHGYELLFRSRSSTRPDGDVMTADVLVRAGLDIGLRALVGTKLAFVNATALVPGGRARGPLLPQASCDRGPGGRPEGP